MRERIKWVSTFNSSYFCLMRIISFFKKISRSLVAFSFRLCCRFNCLRFFWFFLFLFFPEGFFFLTVTTGVFLSWEAEQGAQTIRLKNKYGRICPLVISHVYLNFTYWHNLLKIKDHFLLQHQFSQAIIFHQATC